MRMVTAVATVRPLCFSIPPTAFSVLYAVPAPVPAKAAARALIE